MAEIDPLVSYVEKYYPQIKIDNDFLFQEKCRCETMNGIEQDIHNGWASWNYIVKNYQNEKISVEFQQFIQEKIQLEKETKYPKNIRGSVKAIFTWPLKGYLDWNCYKNDDQTLIKKANQLVVENIEPKIELIQGKLYLTLGNFIDLISQVKEFQDISKNLELPLVPNSESSHITLVNSDIVAKLDKEKLDTFIKSELSTKKSVTFTEIKHTVSFDWPVFSVCVVLSVSSDYLVQFVKKLNEVFGTSVKPSVHLTILICPRKTLTF